MPGEIQVTSDHQTGPVYDPELYGQTNPFLLVNQDAAVDVFLDRDGPWLLNQTGVNARPTSGTILAKGGGQVLWPAGKKVFARADGSVAARQDASGRVRTVIQAL